MSTARCGTATTVAEAEALTASGISAMHDASDDPKRIVDAAIYFSDALAFYEDHQDVDKMCDLRADIFWCKKRMSLDTLNDYLAQVHKDPVASASLARVDKVADAAVPLSEAGTYFTRAQAYADKHPDDWQQISIHFFEVAERFQGSEISLKAQRLSLDAQTKYAQSLADANTHQRETLFTRHGVAGTKADPPTAEELRSNIAKVKIAFQDDFAKTKPRSRLALIRKLIEQAQDTTDDLALRYALFVSARDLSVAQHDTAHALYASDQIADFYTGPDLMTSRKALLQKMYTAVAPAMLKLLDNPNDPDANTVAGKYFCFEAEDWKTGLPMLAKSPEKTLATLAEMELAEPDKTTQMNELADSWYDKGKKSFGNERAQFLERAEYWYQLVLPDTKNITHTIVSKRLEEIDKLLPVREITNYDRISNAQWNRITSPIYEVKAAAFRTDTDIKLDATQTIRVVPQPTDTWRLNNAAKNIKLETTAKGDETMQFSGALLVGVGRNGQASRDMIAHGPGAVWFCSKMNRARGYHADGSIRVKVVPVTDE